MYGYPAAVTCITEIFRESISSYTGARAIEDGVLADVTSTAKEAGFTWPVAATRAAWDDNTSRTPAPLKL